jgi:multicomponent Na+:H+ antiporter subunit A
MNTFISSQWATDIGIDFSFALNSVNIFFGLLVLFIGLGVFLYSSVYMRRYPSDKKLVFYISLTLFTLAMIGLIFADNLLLLFLFWEMTSVTSFFLIGFKNEKPEVREKAKWALYTTVAGGLFLLAGIVLLSQIGIENGLSLVDSFTISKISIIENIGSHDLFSYAFLAIFIGICSKSALFPFSFWLPLAMVGPTPVSSFLHSATMVKAGLFLAIKISPIFGQYAIWQNSFVTIGILTAILAAFQCFIQRNLKTMLAYSTTCVLGIMAILIGLGEVKAQTSFIIFVLAHALYKAALFQIVGYLDVRYKTMDFFELRKFTIDNKLAFIAVFLSTLSMIGIPITMGFYAKEYIYLTALKSNYPVLLCIVFFIANTCMGIQAVNFLRVFWPTKAKALEAPKISNLFLIPALSFSILATVLAIFPHASGLNGYFSQVLGVLLENDTSVELIPWHGIEYPYNIVLILSFLTITSSLLGSFFFSKKLYKMASFSSKNNDFSLWQIYKSTLSKLLSLFHIFFSKLQNGDLRQYLMITISFVCILILFGLSGVRHISFSHVNLTSTKFMLMAGMMIPLFFAAATKSHYRTLVYLCVTGFFISFYYAIHSAMDVSMTQLLVESLSLFFILFVVKSLGPVLISRTEQLINFIFASLFAVTFLLFGFVQSQNFMPVASEYFKENSYFKAKGENIVNVILVDFRALDTFGEVIVVAIAIIGVGSILMKRNQGKRHE